MKVAGNLERNEMTLTAEDCIYKGEGIGEMKRQ